MSPKSCKHHLSDRDPSLISTEYTWPLIGLQALVKERSYNYVGPLDVSMFYFSVSGSTWYASVFLVVNAALGAGLLNFPAAYDKSGGILVAVVIQFVSMQHAV